MTDHEWSELRKAADNYATLAWHRGAEHPAPEVRPNADEEDRIVYRFHALISRADRIERVARDIDAATKPEDLDTLLVDLSAALHDEPLKDDQPRALHDAENVAHLKTTELTRRLNLLAEDTAHHANRMWTHTDGVRNAVTILLGDEVGDVFDGMLDAAGFDPGKIT